MVQTWWGNVRNKCLLKHYHLDVSFSEKKLSNRVHKIPLYNVCISYIDSILNVINGDCSYIELHSRSMEDEKIGGSAKYVLSSSRNWFHVIMLQKYV
jgi:hypothetical protein